MQTATRLALAAAAALILAPAARAGSRPEVSALALPQPSFAVDLACRDHGRAATATAAVDERSSDDVTFAGVHYRPRYRGDYRRARTSSTQGQGVSQVHAGFFDPDGPQTSRFDLGIRGGPMVDQNLQIGLGVDWIHKGENQSTVTSTTTGPGGVPIQTSQNVARASVNMFPIMGFLQVSAPDDLGIVPYFGGGGGYQVMVISGEDFQTGQTFDGTFGGWGWQIWGGAAIPLGGRSKLTGEVFANGGELARDVTDDTTGQKSHETVSADGVGARFGIAWGF